MIGPRLLAALTCMALGGCATTASTARTDEALGGATIDASWFDGQSGKALSADEVAARILAANVILVGEQHAEPRSMATHVAVLHAVRKTNARVAVGVEWLPYSARLAATSWIEIDEPVESLAKTVDWPRIWGHDLAAYRPVLLAVRALGFSLAPINAEPGVARLVARHGLDELPPDVALPALMRPNAAHRAWFEDIMALSARGHDHTKGGGPGFMDRLYLAQLVWDETMAQRTGELARTHDKVVVFAGTGHVGFGFGIPERLPEELTKLVVLPATSPEDARLRALDAPLSDGQGAANTRLRRADLFVVVPQMDTITAL